MDPRLTRSLAASVLAGGLALIAGPGPAQTSVEPSSVASPPVEGLAKPAPAASVNAPSAVGSPAAASGGAAPEAANTPQGNLPAQPMNAPVAGPAKVLPPPGPPRPIRAPTAVMQVLDKVTAETLRFEAPVGRPIRYKTLVMTVKACETRDPDAPQPRPSAYLVIDSQPVAVPGHTPPPAKRVFAGWMFANGPALHPIQHPIYDAWLISCSAAAPPT